MIKIREYDILQYGDHEWKEKVKNLIHDIISKYPIKIQQFFNNISTAKYELLLDQYSELSKDWDDIRTILTGIINNFHEFGTAKYLMKFSPLSKVEKLQRELLLTLIDFYLMSFNIEENLKKIGDSINDVENIIERIKVLLENDNLDNELLSQYVSDFYTTYLKINHKLIQLFQS